MQNERKRESVCVWERRMVCFPHLIHFVHILQWDCWMLARHGSYASYLHRLRVFHFMRYQFKKHSLPQCKKLWPFSFGFVSALNIIIVSFIGDYVCVCLRLFRSCVYSFHFWMWCNFHQIIFVLRWCEFCLQEETFSLYVHHHRRDSQ